MLFGREMVEMGLMKYLSKSFNWELQYRFVSVFSLNWNTELGISGFTNKHLVIDIDCMFIMHSCGGVHRPVDSLREHLKNCVLMVVPLLLNCHPPRYTHDWTNTKH